MKFVREYEADCDAQALYCKLLEDYQHGIQADLHQEKIQEEIQNCYVTSSGPFWNTSWSHLNTNFWTLNWLPTLQSVTQTSKNGLFHPSMGMNNSTVLPLCLWLCSKPLTTSERTCHMMFFSHDPFNCLRTRPECQGQCPAQMQG